MTDNVLFGAFAFIIAVILGGASLLDESRKPEAQRSTIVFSGYLQTWFAVLVLIGYLRDGTDGAVNMILHCWFLVFLQIAVYYAILLPLLPLLRRWFDAKTCARLWMLPSCLYILMQNSNGGLSRSQPKWILRWPGNGVYTAALVWLIGFAAVLLWYTVGHLVYRRQLLRDAREETDPAVLALWKEHLEELTYEGKGEYRLVRSAATRTPLSIGLFKKSIRVVLPERDYTPEELKLIFRHELIHLGRTDCWGKLMLLFCTAMCWFLPLMWIAMRRSADDLELSCDEGVLEDADEETRRKYAELILCSAGDQRGYTTCLSATATALRYRLKNIVRPRKRMGGALLVAVVSFALIYGSGFVALSYGGETVGDLIEKHLEPGTGYEVRYVDYWDSELKCGLDWSEEYRCTDRQALLDYVSSRKVYRLSCSYQAEMEAVNLYLSVNSDPFGTNWLDFNGQILRFRYTVLSPSSPFNVHSYVECYELEEPLNPEELREFFVVERTAQIPPAEYE